MPARGADSREFCAPSRENLRAEQGIFCTEQGICVRHKKLLFLPTKQYS